MSSFEPSAGADTDSYNQGWRSGLAVAALAVAVSAFINLLSFEKSVLAIALGLIAMSGAAPKLVRGRSRLALGIAAAHLLLATGVLLLFHDKLARLLHLLQTLG